MQVDVCGRRQKRETIEECNCQNKESEKELMFVSDKHENLEMYYKKIKVYNTKTLWEEKWMENATKWLKENFDFENN